jgi:hypothetical protein
VKIVESQSRWALDWLSLGEAVCREDCTLCGGKPIRSAGIGRQVGNDRMEGKWSLNGLSHDLQRTGRIRGKHAMPQQVSALTGWTPEQIAAAKLWVQTWQTAGLALEAVRLKELRELDAKKAIALLTGPADYHAEPRKVRPSSGLIEQQRWFMKVRANA